MTCSSCPDPASLTHREAGHGIPYLRLSGSPPLLSRKPWPAFSLPPQRAKGSEDVKVNPPPTMRAAIYAVAVAVAALLVGYGILTEQHATLWLALASAVVNSMALLNTGGGDDAGKHRKADDA